MRKLVLICAALVLAGCASGPYEPTQQILQAYTVDNAGSTKIRVHRQPQIKGSILDESCPLIVYIDQKEVAALQKNQYADLYLPQGSHDLKVKFSCAITPLSKSLTLVADGNEQDYETSLGATGQYLLTRTK